MRRTKRLLSYIMLILVIVVVTIAGTLAYLSDSKETTNVMDFGNIRLVQKDDAIAATVPPIVPDQAVVTEPYVESLATIDGKTNAVPCYVRATVTISPKGNQNASTASFQEYVELTEKSGSGWVKEASAGSADKLVFYYTPILNPGEETGKLYQSVTFKSIVNGKPYLQGLGDDLTIHIDFEAVQTTGVNGASFSGAKDAFTKLEAL